jgi:superfamily II DNA or RNA helicase
MGLIVTVKYFSVNVYSHYFVLNSVQALGQSVVESFARQYVQFGLVKKGRKFMKAPIKVFAARVGSADRVHEYRFHINQFPVFKKHLADLQILPHTYEIICHKSHTGLDIDLKVLEKWIPKDYQVPIIDYLVSDKPSSTKLVETQTGSGKSFMACAALAKLGKRFVIIIKPMYVEKWVSDLKEVLGLNGNDVVVIQGSASLMNLITMAKDGLLTAKAIIISNRTIQNWFKAYEEKGDCVSDEGYDCNPSEFYNILDAGVRLIDEVHQDFHLNFKTDLYTNIAHTISLSATLKGDDLFLNQMYELTYPRSIRYAGLAYNKYVNAYSWIYQVREPNKLRTSEWGSTIYSHHAFERGLVQNRNLLGDYIKMIIACVKQFFLQKYQKGDRLLIYCASIQLCTIVTEHLSSEFKNLNVKRYVEEDSYENLMSADVSVSTLLSAGTGVDIPMLTTVILTTAVSSSQSNIQGFGRLRKIPDRRLQFVYFVCSDTPKHLEYHEKKKDMLRHMALSYDSFSYPHTLG